MSRRLAALAALVVGAQAMAQPSTPAERLHRLLADDWARTMQEHPEFATRIGWPGHDHRWTDWSIEAVERRRQQAHASLENLHSIDASKLGPEDRLSYELYDSELQRQIAGQRFPVELLPLNQMSGIQHQISETLAMMPARRAADYEPILARLRAVPALVEQTLALLRRGLERGLTPPGVTLRHVPDQLGNLLGDGTPLLRPFAELPATIPAREQQRLRSEAEVILAGQIRPALEGLRAFLVETYLPAARDSIDLEALPDGAAWYRWLVGLHTTTDLPPERIHQIGLSEVRRIRGEMQQVIARTGFEGSFAEFLEFLRTDPRFFFRDADALVAGYRDIAKRADPELVKLFGTLPRLPYGVHPVPAYAEKSQTTAYYQPGSLEAGRPGIFFANTYALDTRPRWEMEALTLHEAVPGHHLQIAMAQELQGIPQFRRHGMVTAYVEGWALYAESLGEEMGFYQDPHSRFGRLTYEMWRAVRLVIDTGIHAFGWSRQRAIDFFKENAGKTEHDIVVEVDRYIAWPGQALAYKIGELKIQELRRTAEEALGERFDVRAFHDVILGAGPLPLDALEARVEGWVRSAAASDAGS